MGPNTKELHEITKIDLRYRFLYFLRDLGISSAHEPAVEAWKEHIFIVGALHNGAWDDSED